MPADLASDLSAYDSAEPSLASESTLKATELTADDSGADAKAFLAFLEKDHPKVEHHH